MAGDTPTRLAAARAARPNELSKWLDRHAGLAGRVAYDTSFELVPARDLRAFAQLYDGHVRGNLWAVAPYRVLVLDPSAKKESHALLARPGVKVLLRSSKVIVATQPLG